MLLGCAVAIFFVLFAWSAGSAHAQGNSGVDQYLPSNPDGKGGSAGGSKGGGSNGRSGSGRGSSSGSGSGSSGSGATKDYNGDGTINGTDDKIAAKKHKKDKAKREKRKAAAAAGSSNTTPPASGTPASAQVNTPAKDNGGSSAMVWVIAILLLGPAAVLGWLWYGRRKSGGAGPVDQPTA